MNKLKQQRDEVGSIVPLIIEDLYCEALTLLDEMRSQFSLSRNSLQGYYSTDGSVLASCEAMRANTRMMLAIAWLLNHRSCLREGHSFPRVRTYGRLPENEAGEGDKALPAALLDQLSTILLAQEFYQRVLRIDIGWYREVIPQPMTQSLILARLESSEYHLKDAIV